MIPANIAICECGFLKQNLVKNEQKSRKKLKILDALIMVFLSGKYVFKV